MTVSPMFVPKFKNLDHEDNSFKVMRLSSFFSRKQPVSLAVLALISAIACVGFLLLYYAAGQSFSPWMDKQVIRFGVGLVIMIIIASVDLRLWMSQAYLLYAGTLVLLIGVEMMGRIGMGAQRWIDLYFFAVQPSELMKITLLLALARYFHTLTTKEVGRFKNLFLPSVMVAVPSFLVLRQPDLGTMVILAAAGASIFVVAGMRTWKIVSLISGVIVSLPLIWMGLRDYQKKRVLTFLNPEQDPLSSGYHILQSKIALGSGGFFGKGLGQGTQTHLNFLPEKQTDFIFPMLCEELGAFAGMGLIMAYSILIIYGFRVSFQSRSAFGRYLGVGLTTLLFLSVFINIAMVMGLVPVVGVPLPLVSYGGTAMLTFTMGLGLLMSISVHRDLRFGRNR